MLSLITKKKNQVDGLTPDSYDKICRRFYILQTLEDFLIRFETAIFPLTKLYSNESLDEIHCRAAYLYITSQV